ncbi:MAG: hypothetical protein AMJ54_07270 [Deltaproteobacteria bacterium SG8_13]|nr:MAG: hypothetical protein AMJ54_07270 [Deltaproteobacteria bacterium SG8_13]
MVSVVLAAPASAQVQIEKREPSAGAMTYDLFFLRPFGAAATIVGSAIFVVSLPFSALGRNVPAAGKALVADPFAFTFTRPLGVIRFSPD